jgi:hypothetical protein
VLKKNGLENECTCTCCVQYLPLGVGEERPSVTGVRISWEEGGCVWGTLLLGAALSHYSLTLPCPKGIESIKKIYGDVEIWSVVLCSVV